MDPSPDGRGDDGHMSPQLTTRLLIILSICYGVVIGILGALDSPAVSTVAVIGAMVIGALWAIRAVLPRRDRS